MSGLKVVSGLREVQASFRLLDTGLQVRLRGAVAETMAEVKAGAMARVPVSEPDGRKAKSRPGPGELRDTIRGEITSDGFAGYVKAGYGKIGRASRAKAAKSAGQARRQRSLRAKARARSFASRGLGNYAMVVEFTGKPYMRPARQAAIPGHQARVQRAIDGAVDAAGGAS